MKNLKTLKVDSTPEKPANTYMIKMCFKKCKNCKGPRCPNYFGHLGSSQDYVNYNGILHSKKIRFSEDFKKKPPMDNMDWILVYSLIGLTTFLTVFGGLMF